MAKKSSNPADAFRKAQRAREVKKNKHARKKVREVQTVKRDTRELDTELNVLKGKKDATSKERVKELEKEIAFINKTKEAYVKAHPEAREKVFGKPRGPGRPRGEDGEDGDGLQDEKEGKRDERLYDEQGRLRDPTRSAYYDPVYNPWGVPPPGMPYREREGLPDPSEQDSDSSDDDDDSDEDSDIVMPEGPPPGSDASDNDSDDSDDIPLPEGPPPPKGPPPNAPTGPRNAPPVPVPIPLNNGAIGQVGMSYPPSGPAPLPLQSQPFNHFPPPPGMPPPPNFAPPFPSGMPPPSGFPPGPPPQQYRPPFQPQYPPDLGWGAHYADAGNGNGNGNAQAGPSSGGAYSARPQAHFRPHHGGAVGRGGGGSGGGGRGRGGGGGGLGGGHSRPPRNAPSVQDPLSDAPTQTYQGHRIARAAAANLPPRPESSGASDGAGAPDGEAGSTASSSTPATAPIIPASAEISAAPQLRDLRKEATAFVPRNIKKKAGVSGSGGAGGGGMGRINAAPGAGVVDEAGDEIVIRREEGGLMSALKGVLGPGGPGPGHGVGSMSVGGGGEKKGPTRGGGGGDDDDDEYQKFLQGLGGFQ